MNDLKPNSQRAKNALTLIWVIFTIKIISLLSDFLQYNLLQSVADGEAVSKATAELNDLRQQVIAIVFLVAYIISAVTFIQWFRRAYYNLHCKNEYLNDEEGWAAGCWFVPIMNLYKPYQIMKELYEETINLLTSKLENFTTNTRTVFIGCWWTLWITLGIVGQFMFYFSRHAKTIDELITATTISIVDTLLFIPLALITIKIIKDYAKLEPLLFELKDETETDELAIADSETEEIAIESNTDQIEIQSQENSIEEL